MSNLTHCNLTAKIHTLVQEKAKKHGLELEIESDFVFYKSDFVFYKSINSKISHGYNDQNYIEKKDIICLVIQADQIRQILLAFQDKLGIKVDKFEKENLSFVHNNQGKFIDPLIDRKPKTVLTEFLQILKSI